MARIKPTTTYTRRTPISTSYTTRNALDYLIQEALGKILLESWWGILLEASLNTKWNTPRYAKYVEDIGKNNILDLSW